MLLWVFCLLFDGLNPCSVVGVDLGEAWSLKCRGIVHGIIGKIQFFPGRLGREIVDVAAFAARKSTL